METNNRKQLVTQDNGNIEKIFPKNYMSNIVDEETGESLRIFLLKYNHIDLGYRSSKSSARLAVPIIMRRKGLYITYYLPDDVVITEFFNGNKTEVSDTSWIKDELWVKDVNELNVYDIKISDGNITLDKLSEEVRQLISSKGDITINNFPDNEDLELYTIYQDSNNKIDAIRFKDRDNSNGMAYKYLRKTKNMILSQSDFNKANTIYEIRYDFDLNGNTINIPDSCELKFVGGSLKNGILDGSFTISSNKYNILIDIIAKGILNEEIPIEWFGGKAYSYWEDVQNGVDSNSALENAIQSNGSRIITFNEGYYKITKTINLPPYITIKGNAVNSKYYNIRRTSTPNVPLSSKIYFNSEDEVLFNINNNYISIEDISLHGTRSSDAIHLIDSGYSIKLKNVQIYVWRYGIYRIWDHILRTGFSGSIIDNCSFTELTGGIFIDYDESNAGSELYFITSNDIRNTTFTVCKAFGVYYKSNYSISNNIFKACTFSKIGYGNYELDLYNTFGCYAIKIESFQKSTVNGGNKVESCYFEDIIPYRTGSIVTGETALSNGYIIPTDDTKYSTGIFYNCNIELDTTYYTNILKFFRIDNNTSISIGNARIYSFNTIFNNNVWKYTRLIYHEHSNIVPNYLNQSIVYNNNWRIATTSPLTGLVSYTLYNDRFNALVINQLEDRFADYPPYVIGSASNILSTRQVTGNTIQIDCVCTTSSIESTYIEGYIVYQEKYCKFSIVVDNINASAKFYAVEDSGYQGYGINVKYKKKSDTSFSLYISKTGIKYTIIPIRTSIVSQFKLTAINSSNIPEDSLDVIKLLKVNAISNLPTLNNNFVGYQTYDPNMKLPLFWNGLEWANSDGSLTSKVNTVFTTSQIIYPSRVYKIVSNIDLAGETLTIPINCTLDFQGGSFSNGTIVGNNIKIIAGLQKIFNNDIILTGTWNVEESYPEWFGAVGDGVTNDTVALTKCINYFTVTSLSARTYITDQIDNIPSFRTIKGCGKKSIIQANPSMKLTNNYLLRTKDGGSGIIFSDFVLLGGSNSTEANYKIGGILLRSTSNDVNDQWDTRNVIQNVEIKNCYAASIYVGTYQRENKIVNCFISHTTNVGINCNGTDNMIIGCTVAGSHQEGIIINGNNRIDSCKCFGCGASTTETGKYALKLIGNKCNVSNVELQQNNYGGCIIQGNSNYVQVTCDNNGSGTTTAVIGCSVVGSYNTVILTSYNFSFHDDNYERYFVSTNWNTVGNNIIVNGTPLANNKMATLSPWSIDNICNNILWNGFNLTQARETLFNKYLVPNKYTANGTGTFIQNNCGLAFRIASATAINVDVLSYSFSIPNAIMIDNNGCFSVKARFHKNNDVNSIIYPVVRIITIYTNSSGSSVTRTDRNTVINLLDNKDSLDVYALTSYHHLDDKPVSINSVIVEFVVMSKSIASSLAINAYFDDIRIGATTAGDKITFLNEKGTTSARPALKLVSAGFKYYDTTLNKYIMSNGTAWTNLDGTALT